MSLKHKQVSAKTRTNFWIDMAILVCFVGVSITGLFLEGDHPATAHINRLRNVHSWLGITTVALSLVHFVLHWRWWMTAFRRFAQLKPVVRTNFVIDCVLAVFFVLMMVSGFFLWWGENTHFLLAAHSAISVLVLITVITHIIKHWKWIVTTTRRILASQAAAKPERPLVSANVSLRKIGQQ